MKIHWFSLAAALTLAPAAWAGNVAHCEVLLIQTVEDEEAKGAFQISSYRPAVSFIASVHDDDPEFQKQIDGHDIKALLCRRNDVIPSDADYPMMATGVPFVLSQDFDSPDTDSLTIFWKDGAFDYVYKGYPLSDEAHGILDDRLADFTARGLSGAVKQTKAEATPSEDLEVEIETEAEAEVEVEVDLENQDIAAAASEIPEQLEIEQLEIEKPEIEKNKE